MPILSSVVFDYAFNALWQAPLVVAATEGTTRLLGGVRAEVTHRIWVGCLLLAVVLPGLSLALPSRIAPRLNSASLSGASAVPNPQTFTGRKAVDGGASRHFLTAPAGPALPWQTLLVTGSCWLYLGSIAYAVVKLIAGLWRTGTIVRDSPPALLRPDLRDALDGCLRTFGMTEIAVLTSAEGLGPATVSWPRPMLFLPRDLQGADASEMAAAFCHELAHVRRCDFLFNVAYEACALFVFFHPATHWAMRRLRETREMASDEMAASAIDGRSEYADRLLQLAERMTRTVACPSLTLGVFDNGSLERRVMNLIEKKTKRTLARTTMSAVLGLGLFAAVVSLGGWYGLKPVLAQSSAESSEAPAGWFLAGDKPANYRTGVDKAMLHDSLPSAYLASRMKDTGGFGTLMQTISAQKYGGKRVRLRAWVRSQDVANWAGLWMRVDKEATVASFDNMQQRPIKGSLGWASYDVVLDVPTDATGIAFGVLVSGPGEAWINDLKFEVVGSGVATTDAASRIVAADEPLNLGFRK